MAKNKQQYSSDMPNSGRQNNRNTGRRRTRHSHGHIHQKPGYRPMMHNHGHRHPHGQHIGHYTDPNAFDNCNCQGSSTEYIDGVPECQILGQGAQCGNPNWEFAGQCECNLPPLTNDCPAYGTNMGYDQYYYYISMGIPCYDAWDCHGQPAYNGFCDCHDMGAGGGCEGCQCRDGCCFNR